MAAPWYDAGQERARPGGHNGVEERAAAGSGQRVGADGASGVFHQRVLPSAGLPHVTG